MGHSEVGCWLEVEEVGAVERCEWLPEAEVDLVEERKPRRDCLSRGRHCAGATPVKLAESVYSG